MSSNRSPAIAAVWAGGGEDSPRHRPAWAARSLSFASLAIAVRLSLVTPGSRSSATRSGGQLDLGRGYAERLVHHSAVHGGPPRDDLVDGRGGAASGLRLRQHCLQPLAGGGELAVGLFDAPFGQVLAGLAGLAVQFLFQAVDAIEQLEGFAGVGIDEREDLFADRAPLAGDVPQHVP